MRRARRGSRGERPGSPADNPGTAPKYRRIASKRAARHSPRPPSIMMFELSRISFSDWRSQLTASAQTKVSDLRVRGDRGRPAPNLGLDRASYFSTPAASSLHCCAVSSKARLLAGSFVFAANSAHSDAFVRYSSDFTGMRRCPTHPIAPHRCGKPGQH